MTLSQPSRTIEVEPIRVPKPTAVPTNPLPQDTLESSRRAEVPSPSSPPAQAGARS
jgi:hypothetical protein